VTIESGGSDGQVFVAVRDRGPGIEPQDLGRVTERFYRGRGAPSGGSGLGLAIARQLVEKWGGTLNVESAHGQGTRVEVRLDGAP
jgi:signal transduction histidine kinase